MTENVVHISTARQRRHSSASIAELQQDVKTTLLAQSNPGNKDAEHSIIIQDLHSLCDDVLVRKLALIHRKEADRRNWTSQEEEIAAELEAAAYLAFRSGVPEEAIYDIDFTPLSDALGSAIRKVEESA